MRTFWFGLAVCLGSIAVATASSAETTIKTAEHPDHGTYLTDGSGMALYLFEEDRRGGDRGRAVESDCLDECLTRWPPARLALRSMPRDRPTRRCSAHSRAEADDQHAGD